VAAGNFPAVSYLKASGYADGHAGYSDPLTEQKFLVTILNRLQQTDEWSSTAVIIAYDDSDGWYDHQAPPILNPSNNGASQANGTLKGVAVTGTPAKPNGDGVCNAGTQQGTPTPTKPLDGPVASAVQGRCGYGPRLPLIVISPYAKKNFVDHTLTDQSSILRLIEDNWLGGQRIKGSFDAIAGDLASTGSVFDFKSGPVNGKIFLDPNTGALAACPNCL